MVYNIRDYNQMQYLLLPPSLDDWLPQEHLARFISDVVNELDITPLLRRLRDNGQGAAAYNPAMMLKVLLYAYCVGVPSSRMIAQALVDDVAFRWLAANNRPDFRTIAAFRRRHLGDLKPLFLQVLLLCKQAGLVKVGVVALDGTKVAANAALDRNRTVQKLGEQEKALLAEVDELLRRAEATDRNEDDRFGDDAGGGLPKVDSDAVPEEAKANLTDPESRIMKTRKGFVQGYNAQTVVSEGQVIVACDVVQDCNDYGQLKPMVELAESNLYEIGEEPGPLLADAGYYSEANLEYMAQPGAPDARIAVKKDHKQRQDAATAPRGRIPKNLSRRERMARKLRGLKLVQGEFELWSLTHNLLKLYRYAWAGG